MLGQVSLDLENKDDLKFYSQGAYRAGRSRCPPGLGAEAGQPTLLAYFDDSGWRGRLQAPSWGLLCLVPAPFHLPRLSGPGCCRIGFFLQLDNYGEVWFDG